MRALSRSANANENANAKALRADNANARQAEALQRNKHILKSRSTYAMCAYYINMLLRISLCLFLSLTLTTPPSYT